MFFFIKNTNQTLIREEVLDNFLLNNWTQLVDEKTLYHGNCAASLLDHMYTNEPNFVNEHLIDSDHCCIGAKIYFDGPA